MLLVIRGTQPCPGLSTSIAYEAEVIALDHHYRHGPTSVPRELVFQFDATENPSSECFWFPDVSPKPKFDQTNVADEFLVLHSHKLVASSPTDSLSLWLLVRSMTLQQKQPRRMH